MTAPDPAYWSALADDYVRAFARTPNTSHPPSRAAVVLAMSVAEHETNNGRAWPGSWNIGAVQLRGLTPEERDAFERGVIKAGDFLPDRTGVLHVDTHPTPIGPEPYPVWFAAFPDRVAGIAHFLDVLWRLSRGAPDVPGATPYDVAQAMYLRGYFEGSHAGARPSARRVLPLTPVEVANVADYARAVGACVQEIATGLDGWEYPARDTLPPPPSSGDEAAQHV